MPFTKQTFFHARRIYWLFVPLTLWGLAVAVPDYWHRVSAFHVSRVWKGVEATAPAMGLERFALVETRTVAVVDDNLSGLAFDPERGHLWAVSNAPTDLLALTTGGEVIARYPLQGFHDTESVAVLGDGRLVVAEERRTTLVVVTVPPEPGPIERAGAPVVKLALEAYSPEDNNGVEGLAYDRAADRLYLVKERDPKALYSVQGLQESLDGGRFSLLVNNHREWVDDSVFAGDLSSVSFDPATGRLLLLSDESRLLIEMTLDGEAVAIRSLTRDLGDLKEPVRQPEGVTFDDAGNLYIVGEPNQFFKLSRR